MHVAVAFELEESSDKLEIPWGSADPAIRYLDLRANPKAIDEIEEARGHRPLRDFLAAVNSADSVFSTAKCATRLSQGVPEEGAQAAAEPYEFASHTDLVFALEEFNFECGHYEALTNRLAELLTRETPSDALGAEIFVRRCYYRAPGRWGFYLAVFLHARGATAEQAELRWSLGLARLQQALMFTSRVIRHHLAQAC